MTYRHLLADYKYYPYLYFKVFPVSLSMPPTPLDDIHENLDHRALLHFLTWINKNNICGSNEGTWIPNSGSWKKIKTP